MDRLRRIVWSSDSPAGYVFDLTIQAFIVASVVAFSIETLPGLTPGLATALHGFETLTVIVFSAEYILRIFTAQRPLRYIFSVYGLIDLIAIVPYFLTTSMDMRSIRIIRVLRLFRTLKILRYSSAADRMLRALGMIRQELTMFAAAVATLLYIASVGIYYCERDAQPETFGSIFHSMWWAVVTLTTVGYGDVYPVTIPGRIFTALVLFIGLGVVAVPSGLFASALTGLSNARSDTEPSEPAEGKS